MINAQIRNFNKVYNTPDALQVPKLRATCVHEVMGTDKIVMGK